MPKIVIGIQGDKGSTNERACKFFAEKYGWKNYEIQYLITTKKVLEALEKGKIDYGTFAWSTSRSGLVKETQEAIKKYDYEKVDEQKFQLDHAILQKSEINKQEEVSIYSHPQALEEHEEFIKTEFPNSRLIEEVDTAIAAKNLAENKYPENSVVIAPISCAELYGLSIYLAELPSNKGYFVIIHLVEKSG